MASLDSRLGLKCDYFHGDPMMDVLLDMLLCMVKNLACCMLAVDDCWKKLLTPGRIRISGLCRLEILVVTDNIFSH